MEHFFGYSPCPGTVAPLPLPLLLSPNGLADITAALPPAVSCLRILTQCSLWLHWYAGYSALGIHIYARPSVIRNLHVLKWETELHTQALKILCRYAVKRCV